MSWSFVGKTSATPANITSTSINVPAGVQNGDLLVLSMVGFCSGTFSAPAGWDVQQSTAGQVNPPAHPFFVATRKASSEPASYTVTSTSATWPVIIMVAYRATNGVGTIAHSAEQTNSGYQTTLPPPSLTVSGAGDLTVYGYGGTNSAGSGGGGLTLPSPASLITGSSTGDINNSSGGADYGIIGCQTVSPGSASITTGVDEVNFGLDVTEAAAVATSAVPPAAPGPAWRRRFRHPQQPAQVIPGLGDAFADTSTGTIQVTGGGGDTPVMPLTAQPGRTWLNRFRQISPPAQFASILTQPPGSVADAGTGSISPVGSKGSTGSVADAATGTIVPAGSGGDTPLLPATAQPGRAWQARFRQIQQPAQFASILTQPPGSVADAATGTISVAGSKGSTGAVADSGTGVMGPAGAGADTAVLPSAALPGPAWRRSFRHRQQPAQFTSELTLPPGSVSDACTSTISVAGSKGSTGSVADGGTGAASPAGAGGDTPVLPQTAQPGRAWLQRFRQLQQPAQFASILTQPPGSVADTGTGSISVAGSKGATGSVADSGTGTIAPAGSGGDTPALPPAARPGRAWLQHFRQISPPAQFAGILTQPPGSVADAGTGSISVAGSKGSTGSVADNGAGAIVPAGGGADTAVMPPALPGLAWLRFFRHRQQAVLPSSAVGPALADASAVAGDGAITVSGSKGSTGLVAGSGTGIVAPAGGGADTAVMPPALPGLAWQRAFRHRQQPAQFTSELTLPPGAVADSGTGTISVAGSKATTGSAADAGTGVIGPAGSGGDTPVLPATALPGRAWLQRFRQISPPAQFAPVLTLPPGSAADAGTGAISVTGTKGTSGTPATSGTGTVAPAGSGADTAVMPPALPGLAWQRAFRHRQQPVPYASGRTGALADAGASSISASGFKSAAAPASVTGTGTVAAAGSRSSAQATALTGTGTVSALGARAGSGPASATATSVITGPFPPPTPALPPAVATVQPYGALAAVAVITGPPPPDATAAVAASGPLAANMSIAPAGQQAAVTVIAGYGPLAANATVSPAAQGR